MTDAVAEPPRQKLFLLQYLRAVAALMVVFHHSRAPHGWTQNPFENWTIGEAGVDLFFVLSGFIMYHVGRHELAGTFFVKRLIRIVPMYTLATFSIYLLYYKLWSEAGGGPLYLLKSLLYIPYVNPLQGGHIWPFLVPGWTLNYELFFYGLFAIGLMSRRLWVATVGVLMALVLARLGLEATGQTALLGLVPVKFYTDPILIEFAAGMFIGYAFNQSWFANFQKPLVWLLPLGIVLMLLPLSAPHRALHWGVAAILIMLGTLSLQLSMTEDRLKPLSLIGDASYCLYLFHGVFEGLVRKVVTTVLGHDALALYVFMAGFVGAGVMIAIFMHRWVEKPVTAWLNRLLIKHSA